MRREVPSKAQIKSRKSSAVDFINTIDPTATLAVHCGIGFEAGFSPYRSTRLSR
jgi:hypothetical protein